MRQQIHSLLWLSLLSLLHKGLCEVTLVTQAQNLTAAPGGSVVFLCKANQDLTTQKIQWFFVEHGIQISEGDTILVNDQRKYSFMIPQDSPHRQRNLLVRQLSLRDHGHYRCNVSGASASVTHSLEVEGVPTVPESSFPSLNVTDCCKKEAVSNLCMPACVPDSVNDTFDEMRACNEQDLNKLLFCFSDSRNHVGCCTQRLVPMNCQEFCTATPPAQLTAAHLNCLGYVDDIIACFTRGQALLPTPPYGVSVLAVPNNVVVVNWAPPLENANLVAGYRVVYKKVSDSTYRTTSVLPAAQTQYTLRGLQPQTQYEIYMISVGVHPGSSLPSPRQRIFTTSNETNAAQNINIMKCCADRNVREPCRRLLCSTSTWAHFNPDTLISCYDTLDQVFPCLTSGQNHTGCCKRNDIPELCLGLCAGQPPVFSWNLTHCSLRLPIIEACIQEGLDTLPRPPRMLSVRTVSDSTATLQWNPPVPTQAAITGYQVQWRRSGAKVFKQMLTAPLTFAELTDLEGSTEYEVKVSSRSDGATSLPSNTAVFLTYPNASLGVPDVNSTTEVTEHNVTACCIERGVPAPCVGGCNYSMDTIDFFSSRIMECYSTVTSILGCGSDGRNHTACCAAAGVPQVCHVFCALSQHTQIHLGIEHIECLDHVSRIRSCFEEGVGKLPKHPDQLMVTNRTRTTLSLSWTAPTVTPRPAAYLVLYQPALDRNRPMSRVNTTRTRYILQGLRPGTQYRVQVVSMNDAGTSTPSVTVLAFTLNEDKKIIPAINGSQTPGQVVWANRTHCCSTSGVSAACMGLCLNQDMSAFQQSCIPDLPKVLACASDGQNHTACCQRRLVPTSCLALCQGQTLGNNFYGAACLSYIAPITNCFIDAANLLPSSPRNFSVSVNGPRVRLVFELSERNCPPQTCTYSAHYWPTARGASQMSTLRNVINGSLVDGLEAGQSYSFRMVAHNAYGSSQPTPVMEVFISTRGITDVSIIQDPPGIVPVGSRVVLTCNVIATPKALVYWKLRGGRTSPDQQLVLPNVTRTDETVYTCVAKNDFSPSKSAAIFLNLMYKPYLESFREDSGEADIGSDARLSCRFRGHPNPQSVMWTKDGQRWVSQVGKSFDYRETRAHTGVMAATLKIARLQQSDYGLYRCNASNQFGFAVGALKLASPSAIPPLPKPANQPPNVTACCLSEGVSPQCMAVCSFDIDVKLLVQNTKLLVCLQYLPQFAKCGADGRDHSKCCARKGVTPFCMPFCVGRVPEADSQDRRLFECGEQIDSILGCAVAGHDNIPSSPQDIRAELRDGYLLVQWHLPVNNPHKVKFYRVSYKTSDMTVAMVHSMSNSFLEYRILNVDSNMVYTVWVTAGNDFGESHPSEKVTVHVPGLKAQTPQKLAVFRQTDTTVQLRWRSPDFGKVTKYTVYYKPKSRVRFTSVPTVTLFILLENLIPGTDYEAFVTASNEYGTSHPSNSIYFHTRGEAVAASRSSANTTAIGLGVGIPILFIAIAAAGAVIFLLIRFRRKATGINESVSFENPSFGSSEVQIGGLPQSDMQPESFNYGRLQEEREEGKGPGCVPAPASGAPSEQPNGCSIASVPDAHVPVQPHSSNESKI